MNTPKKPVTKKPKGAEDDEMDEDYNEVPTTKIAAEDEDDFDLPLDDLEPFESFDDDDDDF